MYSDELRQWLEGHKDEMIEDISRLIAIDSVRGEALPGKPFGEGAARVLDVALDMISGYGFETVNMEYMVGYADMQPGKTGLDILAHLDVVPAKAEDWRVTEPFTAKVLDGVLYGRGAADDKGPAVAALYAMRAIRELKIPIKRNVRLILGCDEETGGEDIAYYYQRMEPAENTISPDADFPVINAEKGRYASGYEAFIEDDNIEYIQCGIADNVIPGEFEIGFKRIDEAGIGKVCKRAEELGLSAVYNDGVLKIYGQSGHAAEPELAKNALTGALNALSVLGLDGKLGTVLCWLRNAFPYGEYDGAAVGIKMHGAVCKDLTVSLNRMDYRNGYFKTVFDSRLPENVPDEMVTEPFRMFGEELGLKLLDRPISKAHIVPEDSELVKKLISCYERVTGKKGYAIAIGGGTYVHEIENGVAFGPVMPGMITNIHGNDECIPVKTLVDAAAIYAEAILEING